jgi:hypothetical protein
MDPRWSYRGLIKARRGVTPSFDGPYPGREKMYARKRRAT